MSYLRQEDTWIQQQSTSILTVLAALGSGLTSYLTYSKLTSQPAAFCTGDGGCDLVLSSRWATFLGVPTAALGLLGFLAILILAVLPESLSPLVKKWRWPGLFTVATGMFAFELYMLYLMVGELQQFCLYCSIAIALTTGIWLTVLIGHRWLDWGKLVFNAIVLTLITWVITIGVYANQRMPADPSVVALAEHLQTTGSLMYGASWCPACEQQKELFGTAEDQIPYVECSPNGRGTPQAEVCNEAGVQSYPTWVINGQTLVGVRSLEALALASGYEGDLPEL
jgi:uncharacterized membrane protein/Zn ribbon nucleic-acid-binding protein